MCKARQSGTWLWAGDFAGSGTPHHERQCGPITALTTDATDQKVPPYKWLWVCIACMYLHDPPYRQVNPVPLNSSAATKYILYLPLWRHPSDDLAVGIPEADYARGARIVPAPHGNDASRLPVVWYGTSIVHGAAVSRAGEAFTNRVSRAINRTVLNFGFSGSGHMDLGIGLWLGRFCLFVFNLSVILCIGCRLDAAVFIIDCNWNMQPEEITAKTGPLVAQLRSAQPTTPIVLAEGSPDGDGWFEASHGTQQANNAALRAVFQQLKGADSQLYYVGSDELFAASRGSLENPTVGGCHPSDLGAQQVAAFYTKLLPALLG